MTNGKFTETEKRMLQVLADGMAHTREELHACLPDELSALSAIKRHLTEIRKKLRPQGQDIICQLKDRRPLYRHVRLLASAVDGKR